MGKEYMKNTKKEKKAWLFEGVYTGEARRRAQKIRKKEAIILFSILSVILLINCVLFSLLDESTMVRILCLCGSFVGILIAALASFLYYQYLPKSKIEITNDGFQFIEGGFTRSLPFYKIAPIEYEEEFIVVCNRLVLQKQLLAQGDWEELKRILKKVEASLDSDEPMFQIEEPEMQCFRATVKAKRIYEKFVNGVSWAAPVGVFQYFATFQLEDGEELEYEISQERYEELEEGETGDLALIGGNFFAFGDGEEF